MQVRCPKCMEEQEIPDASHNRRVRCKNCGHRFKGIGMETSQIADDIFAKIMARRAAKAEAEAEDDKGSD